MNYYKRHLGDYAKDTRHLSLMEHGAFCLLLDYYYATEKAIPDDRCERIANAYADAERQAVRNVLNEFFVETPEGWRNSKADEVIAESQAKSLKAKQSAKSRWEDSQCERNANASEKECERNASHKPLAISHKEKQERAPAKPKKAKGETLLTDWLASLPEGEDAIPVDGGAFAYAEKIGLPAEYVALAWGWFKAEMVRRDARQANWRGHFLSALKGNWPKYWYADDAGGWGLTTAGKQAQRAQS